MDGSPCTSAGSMLALRNGDSRLAGQLSELLTTNPILASVYEQLVAVRAGFLVGFETFDRVCGATVFGAPTVTFFISEEMSFHVPQVAFLRPESRPYMIVFPRDAPNGVPCTYSGRLPGGAATGAAGNGGGGGGRPGGAAVAPPPVRGNDDNDDDDDNDDGGGGGGEGPSDPTPSASVIVPGDGSEPDVIEGLSEAEPSPTDGDDDDVCFPASAQVELDTGRTVTMDQLAVGDNVRVSADAFSRVFLFTHKVAAGSFPFVKLTTASGASLTVTRSHYVYANGKMTAAGAVKLGDELELVGAAKCDIITATSPVTETGLYNPQTLHGDIFVNGIRASTFTTAVEPRVASALLAPLRALFRATGVSTSALDAGSARLAALLPRGASVY
ncbi:hypothetical protein BU14_0234s0023 [Porphyra umbilicalis]|uniref:Hint domain-containing protein n=1 Tax=Porphyra umbilicalis TaxID=2786 RepID=A0A1X6P3Z4_PORUM|nr:hypothetical protein BU14_0234s0023 [Porphyra umbilicalis]|eukprot:OSX75496.1 hypothetical protein BU14_0234s0023 [Porphyra umbilicalis]